MNFFKDFGFDWRLFLAQIINFLILAWLFKKFLYKPLLEIMKQREEKIKKGLDDAKHAEMMLKEIEEKQREIIKNARDEADRIVNNAKKTAEEISQEIILNAKKEGEKIINESKEQARYEVQKIENKIKLMSLDISQSVLLNLLKTLFTEEEKDKIMKKAKEKIKQIEEV